jgi:surface antigen
MHREMLGVSRDRFSQTKVLNLKQNSKVRLTEAITASRRNYANYNLFARRLLKLFVQPTSFFSHLCVTVLASTVLLSSVWSVSGAKVLSSGRQDVQINKEAVPLTVATVASASNLSVPVSGSIRNIATLASAQTGFLEATPTPVTDRKAPAVYTVKSGDTIASIATTTGISADTIRWANNLGTNATVNPGQQLTILPVSGVLYQATGGETLDQLATKFHSSVAQIAAANDVDQDKPLAAGTQVIVPGGSKDAPATSGTAGSAIRATSATSVTNLGGSGSFPWGWCTWWVSQKRNVSWLGNAGEWYYNAKGQGHAVGKTPAAGAIYVSWENPYYGHVGYVESVNSDGSYVISEMNYVGFGVVDHRTIVPGTTSTIGFIY